MNRLIKLLHLGVICIARIKVIINSIVERMMYNLHFILLVLKIYNPSPVDGDGVYREALCTTLTFPVTKVFVWR